MGALDDVDLSLSLSREEEEKELKAARCGFSQLRLTLGGLIGDARARAAARRRLRGLGRGWEGGAIKRLVGPLDPRHVRVAQFSAPTDDEKRRHFRQRFWPALPGWGGMAVFDRTWYGRVLVERVERPRDRRGVGARLRGDRRLRAYPRRRGHDPR